LERGARSVCSCRQMSQRTERKQIMTDSILIVDDETDLLKGLERTINMEIDCRVLLARQGSEALSLIEKEAVDVVLTDIRMPEMDGMTLLKKVKDFDPAITVIIMTAYGSIERAVDAIKAGAYDFIQKPFDEERLIHLLKKGLELNRLVRENARLMGKLCEQAPFENMVGQSRQRKEAFHTIHMLAQTDVTVLILGETGTGKDLAAQAIHDSSLRRHRPMVTVNCPALPENILESELFGYRKGAFTHAFEDKKGLFDQAHGSTLFLDEIGDLTLSVQTKLLRVLENKQIRPLGANIRHHVDVRIIAATNQDLEQKLEARQLRGDLYYRLNVATLTLPPLREIREDIPLLVKHFLEKVACEQDILPKNVSPEVMNYLLLKEWPGNIRELENTIRGWCAMTPGKTIMAEHLRIESKDLSPHLVHTDLNLPYKALKNKVIEKFTLGYLYRLLEHTQGNITLSAQISGIKRQSLQKIIKRYGVDVEKYRF